MYSIPYILALFNSFNGRKDRSRTSSKKEEIIDGGVSWPVSRCSSPELVKEVCFHMLIRKIN